MYVMNLSWQQNFVKSYQADGSIKFLKSAAVLRLIQSAIIGDLLMKVESISDMQLIWTTWLLWAWEDISEMWPVIKHYIFVKV